MRKITLRNGGYCLVDDADFEVVRLIAWRRKDTNGKNSYAYTCDSASLTMHRMILGVSDPGIHVDHVNGNGLDNRRCNLRIASPVENARNRRKRSDNTGRYKGVRYHKVNKMWVARSHKDGKYHHLGCFVSDVAAAAAYDVFAKANFGPFAKTNFVVS